MSNCHCDNDLSGCELKVVQYTIVTVNPDPEIKDQKRMLSGPKVVTTSDDLTAADFTAWVIARFLRKPRRRPKIYYESQYLRVCYNVLCRLEMPCVNYQSQQASQLSRIARVLEGDNAKKVNALEAAKDD